MQTNPQRTTYKAFSGLLARDKASSEQDDDCQTPNARRNLIDMRAAVNLRAALIVAPLATKPGHVTICQELPLKGPHLAAHLSPEQLPFAASLSLGLLCRV